MAEAEAALGLCLNHPNIAAVYSALTIQCSAAREVLFAGRDVDSPEPHACTCHSLSTMSSTAMIMGEPAMYSSGGRHCWLVHSLIAHVRPQSIAHVSDSAAVSAVP